MFIWILLLLNSLVLLAWSTSLPQEIIIPPRYPFEPADEAEAPIPCDGPAPQHRRCGDGFFLVTQVEPTLAKAAFNSCPSGYELAQLINHEMLLDAVEIVFLCLGPFGQVWIRDVLDMDEKESSIPVKLIAPDAIEKGCLNIVPARIDRVESTGELYYSLCQRIL